MTAETLLEIAGLEAGYGDVQVLWGVDFHVARAGLAAIIGSNGAGKTTFMRCVSGLIQARAGTIVFEGEDLTSLPPDAIVARGVAHVPEGRRLFAGMTVKDNLLMGAYRRADGAAAIARELEFVLDIFPVLGERLRQDASTLSGGEQQMCAIARGLMSRPSLLLIDELSLGLAPRLVETLTDALKEVNQSGVTIVVVEQDVIAALDLADTGFVMDRGRMVMAGPASELMVNPRIREAYMGLV